MRILYWPCYGRNNTINPTGPGQIKIYKQWNFDVYDVGFAINPFDCQLWRTHFHGVVFFDTTIIIDADNSWNGSDHEENVYSTEVGNTCFPQTIVRVLCKLLNQQKRICSWKLRFKEQHCSLCSEICVSFINDGGTNWGDVCFYGI
jgi:hypothetical protein